MNEIEIKFTPQERDLIIDHTFAAPGLTKRLKIADLDDIEWSQFYAAADRLSQEKIFFDDSKDTNLSHIYSKLRKFKEKNDEISLVILDNLQLMDFSTNKRMVPTTFSVLEDFRQLAYRLGITIIILSEPISSALIEDNEICRK